MAMSTISFLGTGSRWCVLDRFLSVRLQANAQYFLVVLGLRLRRYF